MSDIRRIIATLSEKYGADDFNWFIPADPAVYERQLQQEMPPSHPLRALPLTCVAKNARNDDVLFCHAGQHYLIHLT